MSDTRSDASGAQRVSAHGGHATQRVHSRQEITALSLGALGVVYGDIGTSPLYALRECFNATAENAVPGSSAANVLGVVSVCRSSCERADS